MERLEEKERGGGGERWEEKLGGGILVNAIRPKGFEWSKRLEGTTPDMDMDMDTRIQRFSLSQKTSSSKTGGLFRGS